MSPCKNLYYTDIQYKKNLNSNDYWSRKCSLCDKLFGMVEWQISAACGFPACSHTHTPSHHYTATLRTGTQGSKHPTLQKLYNYFMNVMIKIQKKKKGHTMKFAVSNKKIWSNMLWLLECQQTFSLAGFVFWNKLDCEHLNRCQRGFC